MSNRHFVVNERAGFASATKAFNIPPTAGLTLQSDPGSDCGLTWVQVTPSVATSVVTVTTGVDGSSLTTLDSAITAAFAGAISGTIRARLAVTGAMKCLHVDGLSGQLLGANLMSTAFIPTDARPFATSNVVVSLHNGVAKTSGIASIDPQGVMSLWPSMTKNDDAWSPGATVHVDSFAITFV